MPPELLSRVISSLQSTVEEGFPYHNDRNSLLVSIKLHFLASFGLWSLFICHVCKFQSISQRFYMEHKFMQKNFSNWCAVSCSILTVALNWYLCLVPILQAAAIVCLTRALSVSPSMHVNNMLLGEISAGLLHVTIIQHLPCCISLFLGWFLVLSLIWMGL